MTATSWAAQCCINVADLERTVAFYEALGLATSSRTEIAQAFEAIVVHPDEHGSKLQFAQQKEQDGPVVHGNGFWKLYVNTPDAATTYDAALAAGATTVSAPERLDRWPVTIAFVHDLDGYLVEIVERHPWAADDPADRPWFGQYCINVSDLDAAVARYELLGLTCTSRTDIGHAREAIVEHPDRGSKLQLAQQADQDGPIDPGSLWKLYVRTTDCVGRYEAALADGTGFTSRMAPTRLDRWPVWVAFVVDPDGYQIEIVQKDGD